MMCDLLRLYVKFGDRPLGLDDFVSLFLLIS